MKILLRAKHWQLFMLMYGIQIIVVIFNDFDYEYRKITLGTAIDLMGMFIGIGTFLLWLWNIVINLNQNLLTKLNRRPFKIGLYLLSLNILLTTILIIGDSSEVFLLVLSLLSFGILIYIVLFSAKTLKTIELGREASVSEYIGDFLLFIVFPLGIWFLQPRINKEFQNPTGASIQH